MDAARPSDFVWWVWGVILVTSLIALVGFARAGSTVFWKTLPAPAVVSGADGRAATAPAVPSALSVSAVVALLAALALATIFAGPLMAYLTATADQLYAPELYIRAVLGGE